MIGLPGILPGGGTGMRRRSCRFGASMKRGHDANRFGSVRVSADKTGERRAGRAGAETAAAKGAELVCMPELAFEPFDPQRRRRGFEQLAEPVPGPTTDTFAARARQLGVVVVLNLFERDGHAATTPRRCSTPTEPCSEGRTWSISPTTRTSMSRIITRREIPASRISRAHRARRRRHCYDRHFPEYIRALALGGADLVWCPRRHGRRMAGRSVRGGDAGGRIPERLLRRVVQPRRRRRDPLTFAGESFVLCRRQTVLGTGAFRLRSTSCWPTWGSPCTAAERSHARRLFFEEPAPRAVRELVFRPGHSPTKPGK